ncbi:MAG: response regulator transcription factor [Proteobacteria bacterium]|jgi:two-component system response regulator NreC|nr:response regulator transcription factor [Pseudomonadota bacterium]
MKKTSVVLADDHSILRAGLRLLLESQQDIEVVAEADNGMNAIDACIRFQPDILILDISMPEGSGLPVIEKIKGESPNTRTIVLTMHSDIEWIKSSISAGALGYIVKKYAETELLMAIRSVRQGIPFIKTADESELLPQNAEELNADGGLSDREREVLKYIAYGYTYDEIAKKLFVSVKSVETYRGRIAKKLNLDTRAKMVRYALEIGLIAPGKYV